MKWFPREVRLPLTILFGSGLIHMISFSLLFLDFLGTPPTVARIASVANVLSIPLMLIGFVWTFLGMRKLVKKLEQGEPQSSLTAEVAEEGGRA